MMLDILQWSGMVSVVIAYWFYVRHPLIAATITCWGCLSLAVWSMLITPPAWGILALEASVIIISIRNFYIAGSRPHAVRSNRVSKATQRT